MEDNITAGSSNLFSSLVYIDNNNKFCVCSFDNCSCGENFDDFEWVWDNNSANSNRTELTCQNREILFHPRSANGTTAIRGTNSFQKGHIYYWEIKMLSLMYGTNVAVGVGTKNAILNTNDFCNLIGQDKESWGYSYHGALHHNGEQRNYGDKFDQGSIIGVKLDMWNGNLEFYLNRKPLGIAFENLHKYDDLYPIICSTAAKSSMRMINSTSRPAGLMHHCLLALRDHFTETKELHGIPRLKQYLDKHWWSFNDEHVLYPKNIRRKRRSRIIRHNKRY